MEEILNISKVSEFNSDTSQSFESDMSAGKINTNIYFESEKDVCSDNEDIESDIQHAHGQKQ